LATNDTLRFASRILRLHSLLHRRSSKWSVAANETSLQLKKRGELAVATVSFHATRSFRLHSPRIVPLWK